MPNLAALSNEVKGLPDQALQSELAHPSGLVPSYLVLAEAQRRELTRQAQEKQQAQGQSSSVYDDVIRNMMARQPPQMGLPAPPAGMVPMGNAAPSTPGATPPQNFAAPKPMGMAKGGAVQRYQDGGESDDESGDTGIDTGIARGLGSYTPAEAHRASTSGSLYRPSPMGSDLERTPGPRRIFLKPLPYIAPPKLLSENDETFAQGGPIRFADGGSNDDETFDIEPNIPEYQEPARVRNPQRDFSDLYTAAEKQYPNLQQNPGLLRSVIQQESNENPNAIGAVIPSGHYKGQQARGMAQFMSDTAKSYGVKDPFDPTQAIPGAAHYLSDLIDKHGDPRKALEYYYGLGRHTAGQTAGVRPPTAPEYAQQVLDRTTKAVTDAMKQNTGTENLPTAGDTERAQQASPQQSLKFTPDAGLQAEIAQNPPAPPPEPTAPTPNLGEALAKAGATGETQEPKSGPETAADPATDEYLRQMHDTARMLQAQLEQYKAEAIQRYRNPNPGHFLANLAAGMADSKQLSLPLMFAHGVGVATNARQAEQEKALADYVALGNEGARIDQQLMRAQMMKPEVYKGLSRSDEVDPKTGQAYTGTWTKIVRTDPYTGQRTAEWAPQAVTSGRIVKGALMTPDMINQYITSGTPIYQAGSTKPMTLEDMKKWNVPYFMSWRTPDGHIEIQPEAATYQKVESQGHTWLMDPRNGNLLHDFGPAGHPTVTIQPTMVMGPNGLETQDRQTVRMPAGWMPPAQPLGKVLPDGQVVIGQGAAAATPSAAAPTAAPAAGAGATGIQPTPLQVPQAGFTNPQGTTPLLDPMNATRLQNQLTKTVPVREANNQIFGDRNNPSFRGLIDFAPYAANPQFNKDVGQAVTFTLGQMHEAAGGPGAMVSANVPYTPLHVGSSNVAQTLENYFGVPTELARQKQQMVEKMLGNLTDVEKEAYFREMNALATIIGLRSLTPGSRSRMSLQTIEAELPIFGLNVFKPQDLYRNLSGVAEEIQTGSNMILPGTPGITPEYLNDLKNSGKRIDNLLNERTVTKAQLDAYAASQKMTPEQAALELRFQGYRVQ